MEINTLDSHLSLATDQLLPRKGHRASPSLHVLVYTMTVLDNLWVRFSSALKFWSSKSPRCLISKEIPGPREKLAQCSWRSEDPPTLSPFYNSHRRSLDPVKQRGASSMGLSWMPLISFTWSCKSTTYICYTLDSEFSNKRTNHPTSPGTVEFPTIRPKTGSAKPRTVPSKPDRLVTLLLNISLFGSLLPKHPLYSTSTQNTTQLLTHAYIAAHINTSQIINNGVLGVPQGHFCSKVRVSSVASSP